MVNRIRREAGDTHGRLTLIRTAKGCNGIGGWVCKCSCGNECFVRFDSMRSTQSCGCLRKEKGEAKATHGARNTRAYYAWSAMKQRCFNPNHAAYHNYGGRGITVCEAWMDFNNFLRDMGQPPTRAELDRTDNEKGYSPENCKWVTKKQNANNRRTNVVMDGLTLTQAAEISGHSVQVISWRLNKLGMTLQEAMQTPKLRKR